MKAGPALGSSPPTVSRPSLSGEGRPRQLMRTKITARATMVTTMATNPKMGRSFDGPFDAGPDSWEGPVGWAEGGGGPGGGVIAAGERPSITRV